MFGFYTRSDNSPQEIINNANRYIPPTDMVIIASLSTNYFNRRYIEFLIYNNYEHYGVNDNEKNR